MKVFTCEDFKGHYPVGTAAVIIAANEERAKEILLKELEKIGLKQDKEITLVRVKTNKEEVIILRDGDY